MTNLEALRSLFTPQGRRLARGVWRSVRANREHGGTLEPTTPFVTVTMVDPDGTLRRVHHVPARMVDSIVGHTAMRDEVVLVAEEDER